MKLDYKKKKLYLTPNVKVPIQCIPNAPYTSHPEGQCKLLVTIKSLYIQPASIKHRERCLNKMYHESAVKDQKYLIFIELFELSNSTNTFVHKLPQIPRTNARNRQEINICSHSPTV